MNRPLPPHAGCVRGRMPPLELLKPLIDLSEVEQRGADAHHYWEGDFGEDIDFRYAVFSWTPPRELAGAVYTVARVLWSYANPDINIKGKMFRNACGVTACVNPTHFYPVLSSRLRLARSWKLDPSFTVNGHVVLVVSSSRFMDRPLTHISIEGTRSSICGRVAGPPTVREASTPITCSGCLMEWFAMRRPLIDITEP